MLGGTRQAELVSGGRCGETGTWEQGVAAPVPGLSDSTFRERVGAKGEFPLGGVLGFFFLLRKGVEGRREATSPRAQEQQADEKVNEAAADHRPARQTCGTGWLRENSHQWRQHESRPVRRGVGTKKG